MNQSCSWTMCMPRSLAAMAICDMFKGINDTSPASFNNSHGRGAVVWGAYFDTTIRSKGGRYVVGGAGAAHAVLRQLQPSAWHQCHVRMPLPRWRVGASAMCATVGMCRSCALQADADHATQIVQPCCGGVTALGCKHAAAACKACVWVNRM